MSQVTTDKKAATKANPNVNYARDKDREKVKGIFKFYEVPGGSMSFVYLAYKGDDLERYDFVDGEVYTIPLGVAKHLNNNCWYPEYDYIPGAQGVRSGYGMNSSNLMRVTRKVKRCGFQSLEFIDIPEMNNNQSQIVQVEHA